MFSFINFFKCSIDLFSPIIKTDHIFPYGFNYLDFKGVKNVSGMVSLLGDRTQDVA